VRLEIEKGPAGVVADAVVMTANPDGEAPADDVLAYLMMAHGLSEDRAIDWVATAKRSGEVRFRPYQVPQYLGVFEGRLKRDVEDTAQGEAWQIQGEVVGEVHRCVWDFMLSVPHKPVGVDFKEVG
jgi:hypothetical protein